MGTIITNYADFEKTAVNNVSMWYIIEYSPASLGYSSDKDENYCNDARRYALFRYEILTQPTDFVARLDNGEYRIWAGIPYEYPW